MPRHADILGKLTHCAEQEHEKFLKEYPKLQDNPGSPLPYRILASLLSAPLMIIKKAVSMLGQAERWHEDLEEEVKGKRHRSTPEGLAIAALVLLTAIALALA